MFNMRHLGEIFSLVLTLLHCGNVQGGISDVSGDKPSVDGDIGAKGDGISAGIDLEQLQCLCKLQASADISGNVDASASDGGDCGNKIASITVDCDAVLSGSIDGSYFYIIEFERSSYYRLGSFVKVADDAGYEATPATWSWKGLSMDNPIYIKRATLGPENDWRTKYYESDNVVPDGINVCDNDYKPGSIEYLMVDLINRVLLDGKGCNIEKNSETTFEYKFKPGIYQFSQQLPCQSLTFDIPLLEEGKYQFMEVWFDFVPIGPCKPV